MSTKTQDIFSSAKYPGPTEVCHCTAPWAMSCLLILCKKTKTKTEAFCCQTLPGCFMTWLPNSLRYLQVRMGSHHLKSQWMSSKVLIEASSYKKGLRWKWPKSARKQNSRKMVRKKKDEGNWEGNGDFRNAGPAEQRWISWNKDAGFGSVHKPVAGSIGLHDRMQTSILWYSGAGDW